MTPFKNIIYIGFLKYFRYSIYGPELDKENTILEEMGLGTFLLTIHLDDMSEKANDSAKNIYRKLGIVPETVMYQPERKGLVVDIQSNSGWKRFFSHYLKDDNIVFQNNMEYLCKNKIS